MPHPSKCTTGFEIIIPYRKDIGDYHKNSFYNLYCSLYTPLVVCGMNLGYTWMKLMLLIYYDSLQQEILFHSTYRGNKNSLKNKTVKHE